MLRRAYHEASGELGMATTARLFVREAAAVGGDDAVERLRVASGSAYPVLDAIARGWLAGERAAAPRVDELAAILADVTSVVFVGVEAEWLDAVVPTLARSRLAMLLPNAFPADRRRLADNLGPAVTVTDLDSFVSRGGRRSALVAFSYGVRDGRAFVLPEWLRATGPDVRTLFRDLVAWDVLPAGLSLYPRWLVEAPATDFTAVARG